MEISETDFKCIYNFANFFGLNDFELTVFNLAVLENSYYNLYLNNLV